MDAVSIVLNRGMVVDGVSTKVQYNIKVQKPP